MILLFRQVYHYVWYEKAAAGRFGYTQTNYLKAEKNKVILRSLRCSIDYLRSLKCKLQYVLNSNYFIIILRNNIGV